MRLIVAGIASLFVFSLPLFAQAGEGCPYSEKPATTTASAEPPAVTTTAHEECPATCPDAKHHCSCDESTTAAPSSEPIVDPARTVATTD